MPSPLTHDRPSAWGRRPTTTRTTPLTADDPSLPQTTPSRSIPPTSFFNLFHAFDAESSSPENNVGFDFSTLTLTHPTTTTPTISEPSLTCPSSTLTLLPIAPIPVRVLQRLLRPYLTMSSFETASCWGVTPRGKLSWSAGQKKPPCRSSSAIHRQYYHRISTITILEIRWILIGHRNVSWSRC